MTKNWQEDQEYLAYVNDLITHKRVLQLAEFIQHHNTTRLEHSIQVSYLSYCVAKKI
jgi:hypothetical protein